jgi:signal transduction histidine kinase
LAVEVYQAFESGADAAASEGCLAALLHNADDWLQQAAANSSSPAASLLPAWLAGGDHSPTVAKVAGVIRSREASNEATPPELDLPTCRNRAEQAREAWLAPGSWPEEQLTTLATKLTRLAQLETDFSKTLEREKLHSMAELAAGAGHEINNPLAVIAGRAQLFLHEEKDPERRRGLALINAQAMRVYEMIADLRLYARPPEPERQELDLVRHVDRLLEELGPRAAEQETALRRTGHSGPLSVTVDPAQWAVALKALVTNALEALGGGGHIAIELSRQQDATCVRVIDDGPGIAANDLPHIFDPFFSARQAGRGLGMGLSKCWRIVTNHGGHIDVESQPGHGATFTIRLPD